MNCGIYCIKRYLEDRGLSSEAVLRRLDGEIRNGQLSVLSIKNVLEEAGFTVRVYRENRLFSHAPDIVFDHVRGHFYLFRKQDRHWVYLADFNHGDFRVPRFLFFLMNFKFIICIENTVL